MSKLTSLIRRAPKRFSAVVLMIAAAIIIPTVAFAWGPDRPIYHWNSTVADHVVFNSFIDNPVQGDERNFMRVKEATANNSTYADEISLAADKEYTIHMYYHNNASTTLNDAAHNYAGIAHGAYVKAEIPGLVATGSNGTIAEGYIGATNANPQVVWDEVSFKNTTGADLALYYVPGSTTIHNFGSTNGQTLADSIVTTGAPIGYNAINGDLPGCNGFSGYVTFTVKTKKSDYTIQKDVRVAGQTEYKESVTANPGDTLEYRIQYINTGAITHANVVIKDTLPAHVTYVPGSTTLKNVNSPNGKSIIDGVTTTGVNIGTYLGGMNSNAYVKFSAKVGPLAELACGTNTLVNKASAQVGTGTKEDTATTVVNKECQPGKITVCELSTKKLIVINESDFDSSKYSKDLSVCNSNTISVCEISTKKVITINESDFDSSKHSKDLGVCVELPHTGPTENIVAIVGLGALIASLVYYIASRRALNQ